MAENTNIAWADHTMNFWTGCTKVSEGCTNCYMYALLRRNGKDPTEVKRTSAALWGKAAKWNLEAAKQEVRTRVFTCSLSDFFHPDADEWRDDAWQVIRDCPNLDFMVLTKRPERIKEHLPPDWGSGYANVWLGVTVEANRHVGRADILRGIPARVRFISAEPLLGSLPDLNLAGIHWIIVGGESGPNYRHMSHEWARQLRDAAQVAGVSFFFKQSADNKPGKGETLDGKEYKAFPLPVL